MDKTHFPRAEEIPSDSPEFRAFTGSILITDIPVPEGMDPREAVNVAIKLENIAATPGGYARALAMAAQGFLGDLPNGQVRMVAAAEMILAFCAALRAPHPPSRKEESEHGSH